MNKKRHYFVIIVCIILFAVCIVLLQHPTNSSIFSNVSLPSTTTVQFEKYSIKEKRISFDDVHVSYPILVLDDSPSFEEYINNLLFEDLCCGENEQTLKDYPGCQVANSSYNITFANEDIVSICIHTDVAQGLNKGIERWYGITFSISEQRLLRLSDVCTWEDVVQCVDTSEDLLNRMPEAWNYQYDVDELPTEIRWDSEDYFYLGPDFVGLILPNRATSR